MSEEKKYILPDGKVKDLIEKIVNATIVEKTKELIPIGYIDIFTIACDIIEKVSNIFKSEKNGKPLTSSEKLEASREVIVNLALRLKMVPIPGKKRTILTEGDYNFIMSLDESGVTDTVGTVIVVVRGTKKFGDISGEELSEFVGDVAKTDCLCFGFFSSRGKKK